MRRAKIVCTLGPATSTPERIRALVEAGMDVARLNLSHGGYEDHERVYRMVREASDATGRGVGVFVDLQGPKIRLGKVASGPVELEAGQEFTITTRSSPGDATIASTTYEGLPGDVAAGDTVLIDDGKVMLRVLSVDGTDVRTTVEVAGPVSSNKGINLPGSRLDLPALTDKDRADLAFGLAHGVDLVALSFVRRAADLDEVRAAGVPVVAKFEKAAAVERMEEIVAAADAVMVARGDLGVEIPLERVPVVQKALIACANPRRIISSAC